MKLRLWAAAMPLLFMGRIGTLSAEPLRLVVPSFFGPEPLSQQVRTTLYFEVVKGLSELDAPRKGAWVIYGLSKIDSATHDAVVDSILWPSVRGDLAFWGQVHKFDDGAVVELYLSVTPLLQQRQVHPEVWRLTLRNTAGQPTNVTLETSKNFYTFEPIILSPEAIVTVSTPEGIDVFADRKGGKPVGKLDTGVMYFDKIYDDAIFIRNQGWVRTPPISGPKSAPIAFVSGVISMLRGDWQGARQRFGNVLASSDIPQELRVQSLYYRGLVTERSGQVGREDFEAAFRLNPLDRTAASYLLMSRVADMSRLQSRGNANALKSASERLRQTLEFSRPLFPVNDPWLKGIERMLL